MHLAILMLCFFFFSFFLIELVVSARYMEPFYIQFDLFYSFGSRGSKRSVGRRSGSLQCIKKNTVYFLVRAFSRFIVYIYACVLTLHVRITTIAHRHILGASA